MSKRDLLEGKKTKLADKQRGKKNLKNADDTARMMKQSFGAEKRYVRATFTLEESDIKWLTQTVREYKRGSFRDISKSELVRIGLHLLKNKDLKEVLSELT